MKSPMENRKPYSGLSRSLVIAIDVGTTFSGVSYAILEPGEIPKIHGVTRFPGQEHVAGNTKIPSIIYYDRHGKMMVAGAEAEASSVVAQAEEEGWIKTDLFKLRLRPRTMQLNMNGMRLGALPRRKTAVHVFGDFLAYLYRCTRNFITDTHGNGAALWNAVETNIQFVLSHPNGWEGAQQSKMRRSAVYGGLIPDTNEGKARIKFVTEGEASLHACVLNGLAADVLSNPSQNGFLIADAGGGTLDISAYAIRGTHPLVMEEIAPPDCIFAGSIFVSRRAREFLQDKLKGSKYGTPDALDHITQRFDETTKRLFRDRKELQFIHFGSPLDKDPAVGIRNGHLKLTGNEVANLFEPSVDAAVSAIKAQIEASNSVIKSVFLVGGYAASPWLFSQLQERLAPLSMTVSRPDTQTSKAVADGAVGFYCDHHVSARMSKFMYGVEFLRELDSSNPNHVARKERLCELPSGPRLLPDAFDCILKRSVKVKESMVFTRKYCTELTSLNMLSVFEVEIWCYRGGNIIPEWIDRQADDFSTLCVVRADLSPLAGSAEPKEGKGGKTYWTIVFSVEIHFGLTEFKARIKWVDDGKTKYGPASIIYNERGHRADEEEPDVYPEDEAATSSPQNGLRSEPASRARTPVDQFYHPTGNEARQFDASPIGETFSSEPLAPHHEHTLSSQPILSPSIPASPATISRNLSSDVELARATTPVIRHERTPSFSQGWLSSGSLDGSLRDISRGLEPGEKETPQEKKNGKDKTPTGTPNTRELRPSIIERTPSLKTQPANGSLSLWPTDPVAHDIPRSLEPSEKEAPPQKKKGKDKTPADTPDTRELRPSIIERTPSLKTQPATDSLSLWPTDPVAHDILHNLEPSEKEVPQRKKKGKDKTPAVTPNMQEPHPSIIERTPSLKTQSAIGSLSSWPTDPVAHDISRSLEPSEKEAPQEKKKGKDKTLAGTSNMQELRSSPLIERTPSLKTQLATESLSLRPESAAKEASLDWGSSLSPAKETNDVNPANKASPGLNLKNSPMATIEPAAAANTSAPEASPALNTLTTPAKASPVTKKGKKKGASAITTPAIEHEPLTSESAAAPPKESVTSLKTETQENKTVGEPTSSNGKPVSTMLTPIELPEVTLSTKTPEYGALGFSDDMDVASSLFNSNTWGDNSKGNDTFDTWGFNKPKTPASHQSPIPSAEKSVQEKNDRDGWDFDKKKTPKSRQSPEKVTKNDTDMFAQAKTPKSHQSPNIPNVEAAKGEEVSELDSLILDKTKTPKTPKSRQSPATEAKKPDDAQIKPSDTGTSKVEESKEAEATIATPKTSDISPEIKPAWGATPKISAVNNITTASATSSIGWGASTKKLVGSASASKTSTPVWGVGSSLASKPTEAKTPVTPTSLTPKSPWASKSTTPVKTPASPWGAKTLSSKETQEDKTDKEVKKDEIKKDEVTEAEPSTSDQPPTSNDTSKDDTPSKDLAAEKPQGDSGTTTAETSLHTDAAKPAVGTPNASSKVDPKPSDTPAEQGTAVEVTSPTAEDGEENEDKEEENDKDGKNEKDDKKTATQSKKKKKPAKKKNKS